MLADANTLPDPRNAGLYVRYVELCRQVGVDPSPPERVRELVAEWNAMLKGSKPGAAIGLDVEAAT